MGCSDYRQKIFLNGLLSFLFWCGSYSMCGTYDKSIQNFGQNLEGKRALDRPKHMQADNIDFK
jgi:hypothetical protein